MLIGLIGKELLDCYIGLNVHICSSFIKYPLCFETNSTSIAALCFSRAFICGWRRAERETVWPMNLFGQSGLYVHIVQQLVATSRIGLFFSQLISILLISAQNSYLSERKQKQQKNQCVCPICKRTNQEVLTGRLNLRKPHTFQFNKLCSFYSHAFFFVYFSALCYCFCRFL